ncbi:MAG: hypothetical protein KDC53_22375 [Saprospiraceae bacterium]|nr:hypothetical protein [Saprospiraceae bacterium]
MNFYEFLDLDERGKAFAIWHYGVFLMSRTFNGDLHKLYAIEDFYVEVCHNSDNQIAEKINSFESVEFLDPYLDQINLDDLISMVK